jgi:hypothetical protein
MSAGNQNNNDARVLATQWRKVAKRASGRAMLTLPSGMIIKVQRPNVGAWIRSGRVPQTVVQAMLGAVKSGGDAKSPADAMKFMKTLGQEQLFDVMKFMRDLVVETVLEPRIVENAPPDSEDEISPGEIPDEDFDFIAQWAMEGTIDTKGGEQLTGKELKDFRADGKLPTARKNSRKVRAKAVGTGGN